MIELKNVKKYFKKPIRKKGVIGMFTSLFSRKYSLVKAVDDVSFIIKDGEAVGYIGANGAGKSTTIKMMSGILTPTSGEILIDGMEPYKSKERNKVLKDIGVVFGQKTQLWYDLPLTETYDLLRCIYEISEEDYQKRLNKLIKLLGLEPFLDAPVRTLSLGQRMRADLAASMLHNPKILFLDEPTIGLDVLVKKNLIEAIKEIRKEFNTTLILTTHAMSDIEQLCSRVIILDEGKILYDGALSDIKKHFGDTRTITITTINPINQQLVYDAFKEGILNISVSEESSSITNFKIDALKLKVNELLEFLLKTYTIIDMKTSETTIEEIVEKIYEDKKI